MEAARSEDDCAARGRGRPRDPETDEKILRCALDQLAEDGYAGMSIDGVARAAGVSKATIYRRFADKSDLATAAVVSSHPDVPSMFEGDTRSRLIGFVEMTRRKMIDNSGIIVTWQILSEAQRNPELVELHRTRTIGPRLAVLTGILEDGVRAGDVRADADIDLVTDMLTGSWMARWARGNDFPRDWSARVVDALWPAIAA